MKYLRIILLLFIIPNVIYSQQDNIFKIKTVVIDPGHGGKDPGAVGKVSQEKNITLALALKVGKYINDKFPDIKVVYTRSTDVFVELHQRANIANKNNADLFISIHVNANTNRKAVGTDSWVMGLDKDEKNLEVAKMENKVILVEDNYIAKYEGLDPNASESYIIFNLIQNVHKEQSLQMAALVQKEFKERVGRIDRGVNPAPFLVLWKTTMPSILIETGFISNEDEEKFLSSEQGQDYMASAIYRAFRDYKTAFEKRSNVNGQADESNNRQSENDDLINKEENKTQKTVTKKEDNNPTAKVTVPEPKEIKPDIKKSQITVDTTKVHYYVQLMSSSQPLKDDSEQLKKLPGLVVRKMDNAYKYLYGIAQDYEKAKTIRDSIKTEYPNAFIIAIHNGKRISLNEAFEITNIKTY